MVLQQIFGKYPLQKVGLRFTKTYCNKDVRYRRSEDLSYNLDLELSLKVKNGKNNALILN